MKQLTALLLVLTVLISLAACSSKQDAPKEAQSGDVVPARSETSADVVPTVLNQTEYVLYQNIFFNGQADEYVGKKAVKVGTLARLEDRFNDVTRYYVWGYNDATKCCDWQWEFVPADPASLPASGCLVKMTGTLVRDDAALDKLWFTQAEVTVQTDYAGPAVDVDMCTMSATLERVQIINLQVYSDDFADRTVRAYGRVMDPDTIQHPYYDNAWTQEFRTEDKVPAIGTVVIVSGKWDGGSISDAAVEATKNY